jgi:hypothetical protein
MRTIILTLCAAFFVLPLAAQKDKYEGPTPPKDDVPYLLHATNLVETEVTEAAQEDKKNATFFAIKGASSPVRTPLAEPIFIIKTAKINADKLELYKFESIKGRRELTLKERPGKNDPRPLHLTVTKVGKDLYRVEVSEQLENGEYSLSPASSNQVFAFQVY